MLKKDKAFFSFKNSQKHVKYLILFIWLSIVLHLYLLWGVNSLSQLNFRNQNNNTEKSKLLNIILETKTESLLEPQDSVISDKNNISSSEVYNKDKPEEYNVANFNPAEAQGQKGTKSYIPQEEIIEQEQKSENPQETKDLGEGFQIVEQKEIIKQVAYEGGGETAPTLYDVKKEKQIINLYNTGNTSLATRSKEYAAYFIGMQKKIERYHKEFFPIYQYYQGLLKDGEVVVEYNLDTSGDILDAKIVSSYGSDTVDNASLNSIVYAKSFGELPEDLKKEGGVTVRFHFIYLSR